MSIELIGHGTWLDKVAAEVLEREKKLGRELNVIKTESGFGASGFPHVGSFGDVARAYGVALAIEDQGRRSELIAYCDDKDGLRRVPAGLPSSLERYLGHPVTSVPDPYSCHGSYGEHMSSLLLEALDTAGIRYTHLSATKMYASGVFSPYIEKVLENSNRVGEIIREETGQEKYLRVLPYHPVCDQCGKVYSAKATEFLPKEQKVLYVCEGDTIKGHELPGCGHQGEADYSRGEGKLNWKVEFAVRWAALGIDFEAYGKDIADSVRVNDRVCQEILNEPPPYHIRYEMFLDKGGRKISKSTGNVFTPQIWFEYGSSQSLLLLMFKRVEGARELSVGDIPRYMDEFDELEDIYFGLKKIKNPKEEGKLKGLFEYCYLLEPPTAPSPHVPYNLLTYLVNVAPKAEEGRFIESKLRAYGYIEGAMPGGLKERVEYARRWVRDFATIEERPVEITDVETSALRQLVQFLSVERDEEEIQGAIFSIGRKNDVPPPRLFKILYLVLIGDTKGPRMGPYIKAMGRMNVVAALQRVTAQT